MRASHFPLLTQQVPFQVLSEGLVSQPIDEGTDETWQDTDEYMYSEANGKHRSREDVGETNQDQVANIGEHAEAQPEAVKDHSVPALLGIH